VYLVVRDGVAAEHADERAVVSDADIHDHQTVVARHQHVHAVSDQRPRRRPTRLHHVPRHTASAAPAAPAPGRAAGRQRGAVEV